MTAKPTIAVVTPDIGASGAIHVGQWLVDEGDSVREGDRLVELVADGVVWIVASPATGHVAKHRIRSGATTVPEDELGCIARAVHD